MALHTLHALGRNCTHVILNVGHTRSLEQGHQSLIFHAQIFRHFINTQLDAHPTSDTELEALNGGALTGPSSATSSVCTSAVVIPSSKIAMTPVSGRPITRPSSSFEPKPRALPLFTRASTQGVSAAARASQATSTSFTSPAAWASRTAVEPAAALRARNAAPISEYARRSAWARSAAENSAMLVVTAFFMLFENPRGKALARQAARGWTHAPRPNPLPDKSGTASPEGPSTTRTRGWRLGSPTSRQPAQVRSISPFTPFRLLPRLRVAEPRQPPSRDGALRRFRGLRCSRSSWRRLESGAPS